MRDYQQPAEDGDGVLDERCGKRLADGLREPAAKRCSSEGSRDGADRSGDEAEDERLMRNSDGRTGEAAHDDARDELRWNFAAGSFGKLIVDQLTDGGQRKQPARDGAREEVKRRAFKVEP